uniref:Pentatricopeptide repeat-containing protein n=1 Tax=Solanum lycopersicum TaxID=4081 RepID=K4D872_SOLLC
MGLFSTMKEENTKPSEFTLVSLLNACGHLGALDKGNWIYMYVKKNNVELNVIIVTAIIDMYCNCGNFDMASHVFVSLSNEGLSSWNSMILGLDTNGLEDDAIKIFASLQCSILKPDSVTFINVLTACNHSGLVDKLDPNENSGYVLMENIYATSGLFEEALDGRISMEEKHIAKEPGCSPLEITGEDHEFASGRKLYSEFHDIYSLMH